MYELKILNDDDFFETAKSDPRYEYVDETNMGFADRQKNIAYVRHTNHHDLNKYLINHELEELEQDESTHEDPNGIRHKKFFKDLVLPTITGGLIKPEAPARQAAQTTNVPGFGNILNSQLNNSYTPSGFTGKQAGGFGFGQSPLNSFSGSYSPANTPSSISGGGAGPSIGLGGGLTSDNPLTPEQMAKLRAGNYAGRVTF